jgi:hypothetical protein
MLHSTPAVISSDEALKSERDGWWVGAACATRFSLAYILCDLSGRLVKQAGDRI